MSITATLRESFRAETTYLSGARAALELGECHVSRPASVEVDPNSVSRRNPRWSVVRLSDFDHEVAEGDLVWAEQPDEDADCMAPARVRSVDRAHDLVDLEVDWTKFVVVERPQPGTTFSRAQTPAFAWVKWQKNFSEPRTLNYYLRSNG